jgi:hypothetical protein
MKNKSKKIVFFLLICFLILNSSCIITKNIKGKQIALTHPQSSSLETGGPIRRKSVLISGNITSYIAEPQPIVIHDTNITTFTGFLIHDSTIIDNTSLLYQPRSLVCGTIGFSISNHILFGGTFSASLSIPGNIPGAYDEYLNDRTNEFSGYIRLNTYSKPWSFTWRPELTFGHVRGQGFYIEDSLSYSEQLSYKFTSFANTFTVRYQPNRALGFYSGLNLNSRPYALDVSNLRKDFITNLYLGTDINFSRDLSVSLYYAKPTSLALTDYNFPGQICFKLNYEWFFRKSKTAD